MHWMLKVNREMMLVGLAVMIGVAAMAQQRQEPLERIAVQPGKERAEFVLKESREPLFAKGFNYIRLLGDHATFDADTETTKANYDPEKVEEMLRVLCSSGYNTVRVFVIGRRKANSGIPGNYDATQALYEHYMDNCFDFLRQSISRAADGRCKVRLVRDYKNQTLQIRMPS